MKWKRGVIRGRERCEGVSVGAKRPFVGRRSEMSRAAGALRHRRGVVLTGPRRSGRSRLLAEVLRDQPRTVLLRGSGGPSGAGVETPLAATPVLHDAATLAALLDEVAEKQMTLAIDDLDQLPIEVLAPLVDSLRRGSARFIGVVASRQVIAERDSPRSALLRALLDETDAVTIAVPPLSLTETAALGDALRKVEHGARPADGPWLTALHQLSGGSPALVTGVVAAAAALGRFSAPVPLDPRNDPVPGGLVDVVHDILGQLDERARLALGILDELGAIPAAHVRSIVSSQVLTRLVDHRLLSAAPDPGTASVSALVGRYARECVGAAALAGARNTCARELLALARQGAVLTPHEEVLCARLIPEAGEDLAADTVLMGMLPRAALALARSGSPAEAFAVAERAQLHGPDFTSSASVVLAHLALGRRECVGEMLDALPLPRDRSERELGLRVLARSFISEDDPGPEAIDRLVRAIAWAPEDAGWRVGVESLLAMLARTCADARVSPMPPFPVAGDDLDGDDRAFAEACEAMVAAFAGDRARAWELLQRRRETHGLLVEPVMSVFCLHAFAHVVLATDLDLVQSAVRRRLLAAQWADHQDHIVILTAMDATLQMMRGRNEDALLSLQGVRVVPPEPVRVWCDAVRVIAYLRQGDVVRAAAALERLDGGRGVAASPGVTVVREMVRALFESASSSAESAAVRALRALPLAERALPIVTATLLRVALAGGVAPADVLGRATQLAARFDLDPLHRLVGEISASMKGAAELPLDRLTAREREVVLLSAAGSSNAEIAEQLHVSIRTVESHLHHARTRLGMTRYERFSGLTDKPVLS